MLTIILLLIIIVIEVCLVGSNFKNQNTEEEGDTGKVQMDRSGSKRVFLERTILIVMCMSYSPKI